MYVNIIFTFVAITCILKLTSGHSHEPRLMTSVSHVAERHHIGSHMDMVPDINSMAEDELRFLYFKMHDSNDDNKLDGCELVKSLLHWHSEEHSSHDHGHGTTKIFGNDELSLMIDPILATDDRNSDGFIDYSEFVAGQTARGL